MSSNLSNSNKNNWRFYNVFSVKEKLFLLFRDELKKRNIVDYRIISRWKDIVGEEYSKTIVPVRISMKFNKKSNILEKTLFCTTDDILFATKFLFLKQKLLGKINVYFGEEKSVFTNIVVQK